MSFENSNYTQVPNLILDNLGELKPAELKVILTITRATLGWHRRAHRMSITCLMEKAELSNRAVITACDALCDRDWIERHKVDHKRGHTYEYTLKLQPVIEPVKKVHGSGTSEKSSPHEKSSREPVKKVHGSPVKKVHGSKERSFKETPLKENTSFSEENISTVSEQVNFTQDDQALDADQSLQDENIPPSENDSQNLKIGIVTYKQLPETIDLAEVWELAEYEARRQAREIAPKHKHPQVVAHGLGQIWLGPGQNDFDEDLLQILKRQKQKVNQPCDRADCINMLWNLISGKRWSQISNHWDSAVEIKRRRVQPAANASLAASCSAEDDCVPPPKDWAKNALAARYRNAN
ncbi:phage replication protein [Leptolyngbya sp. Heron Island J]|uniref:replication protein n=1 Tax=Leptolyngbya sp. Heron Island J TaxID=1385935 RepID=UPI0003B964FA|nr:replication protein [Leptolyngbya sp. Heron Island J]ESA37730.1 phage replication protein [Leptolyngbya sp. Heron Island J]